MLLTNIWRWWTESWRSGGRARLLYVAMAVAFAGLAVVAAMNGDAAVATLAGLVALGTVGLAVIAPRLARSADAARRRSDSTAD